MFTVCPKCALPLAVTAADLRAGQGYVRCGRCANVFNALLRLTEESALVESGSVGPAPLMDDDLDRASATMSRPALPEPVVAEPTPEPPEPPAPVPPEPAKPWHVEDEFYDPECTNPKIGIAPLPLTPPAPGMPRPAPALRLIDSPPRPPPGALALDEQHEEEEEHQSAGELDAEPAEESTEDESGMGEFRGTSTFETIVLEGDTYLQTEERIPEEVLASEIANVSRRIAEANNTAEFEALVERLRESDGEPEAEEPPPFRPAPELVRLAPEFAALREATGDFKHLGNVGMEGEDPSHWFGAIRSWGDWRINAAAAVLAVILILQALNHWRDELATHAGLFGPISGLASMLGEPLRPNWDLAAYDLRQLGAAADSADNQTLKVRLSLTNVGKETQALPLIRLTLRDRYGKAVSRGELQPAQYLPKDERGQVMIRRDQRIDTEVRVLDPARQASSFELDVCVAAAGGGLRCAGDTPSVARAL